MDGVPTVMLRVGNDRESTIVEALIRVVMIRTVTTKEGTLFHRTVDLPLQRDSSLALSRSWTVLHTTDEKSPLFGLTPEARTRQEVEIKSSLPR